MCWGPLFCGGEADVQLPHVSISRTAKAMRELFEQGLEQSKPVTLSVAHFQSHPNLSIACRFQLVTGVSSAEAKMSGTCKCSTSRGCFTLACRKCNSNGGGGTRGKSVHRRCFVSISPTATGCCAWHDTRNGPSTYELVRIIFHGLGWIFPIIFELKTAAREDNK